MSLAEFRPASTLTLHSRIREELRERILRGDWQPQQRVPSESELMAQYGVSRITVRQAMGDLERIGLIVRVPGKGSFVSPAKPFQELDRLQGFAEAMRELGHATANRLLRLRSVEADERVAQRLALPAGSKVTELQRVRLLDGRPLSVDLSWLPHELGTRLRPVDLVSHDVFRLLEHELGAPLGHADLVLDAVAADDDVAALLELPPGAPVLRIERLTHDGRGRPIDYEHLHCRCDAFQYRLRLHRRRHDENIP